MSAMHIPVSEYARSLVQHVLERYKDDILAVGIDPFLVSEKEYDPKCLPPMESIDLVSFLVLETSYYSQNQFKAFKIIWLYQLS